jgi:hypothetical protein
MIGNIYFSVSLMISAIYFFEYWILPKSWDGFAVFGVLYYSLVALRWIGCALFAYSVATESQQKVPFMKVLLKVWPVCAGMISVWIPHFFKY